MDVPEVSSSKNSARDAFQLGPFAVDENRRIRVVVIGAGFSGIAAGIRIPQRTRNVDLVIYEQHAGVGGTWFINTYPGIACDVPTHAYQYTFEPNPHWSTFYAPGSEIQAYLERVAEKYKVMRYIKLNHKVTNATWDAQAGKWKLVVSTSDGEIHDVADIVISCTGPLDRWNWPEIHGLFDFKGSVVHSAKWDLSKEAGKEAWKDKKVAVIGVGSSALQIVPSLQPKAEHLVNFVRSKTWVLPRTSQPTLLDFNPAGENHTFSEEEIRRFEDPEYYFKFRIKLENELMASHGVTLRGHQLQQYAVKAATISMTKKLDNKPWLSQQLIPNFPVACRRPTPGTAYLQALLEDNVELVSEDIKSVTPNGIETVDGKHRDFDMIVCATGFDTTWKPHIPTIGRDGITLQDKWDPYPMTYLSIATDGFPNLFTVQGPNSGFGSGSLIMSLEAQIDYATSAIAKLQRERLKSIEVKKEAVRDFDEYVTHYFPQTVFSEKCRAWYKMGKEEGHVVGVWPGSCIHAVRALKNPRWEDFNYEPLDEHPGSHNRFHWLGNGWTIAERDGTGNRAWYLNEIDYPPVPE